MAEKIMQCCYTNATHEENGMVHSGWQVVSVSRNIPDSAYKKCTEYMSVNSEIHGIMSDENGEILNLLEINGDGTYVYVIRTKYGLKDRLGRGNMFAHGFIFDGQQTLKDPNLILTLTNENFKYSEEEADQIPDELKRFLPFDIEQALQITGISDEQYITLIQTVLLTLTAKDNTKAVYVQYNGDEMQMRAMLYCIYYALPYSLRTRLSSAAWGGNKPEKKTLIFTRHADHNSVRIDPVEGHETVLTKRAVYGMERAGYGLHAVKNFRTINVNDYFDKLERQVIELNGNPGFDDLAYRIAYFLIGNPEIESLDNQTLLERFGEALSSRNSRTVAMEKYLIRMIKQINERKLVLQNLQDSRLQAVLIWAVSDELREEILQYNISSLENKPVNIAAERLARIPDALFSAYFTQMKQSERGQQILDYLYANCKFPDNANWNDLDNIIQKTEDINPRTEIINRVVKEAYILYQHSLILKKNEKEYLNPKPDYNELIKLLKKIKGEEEVAEAKAQACKMFWEAATIDNFSRDCLAIYDFMQDDDVKDKRDFYTRLAKRLKNLSTKTESENLHFMVALCKSCMRYQNGVYLDKVFQMIREKIAETGYGEDLFFADWCEIYGRILNESLLDNIRSCILKNQPGGYANFVFQLMNTESCDPVALNLLKKIALNWQISLETSKLSEAEVIFFVPLDAWLATGALTCSNAFDIFDEIEITPKCFEMTMHEIVNQKNCNRILQQPYFSMAKEYGNRKSKNSQVVKKWVQEYKKLDKRTKSDSDTNSLFGGIGSLFSKK